MLNVFERLTFGPFDLWGVRETTPPPAIFAIFHSHPPDLMALTNKMKKNILVSPRHHTLFRPVLYWRS
jgi:hypothetical protein